MKTQKQSGSAHVVTIVILVAVILGLLGFVFRQNFLQKKDVTPVPTTTSVSAIPKTDPNAGYLVVQEWGLRFKVPSGLMNVQYKIFNNTSAGDDELAFYAKPTGYNVQYITNYQSFSNGFPTYALGILYRSTSATKENMGETVAGKKLDTHYYYTAWAFSGLATGAACVGLYGDDGSSCQAESVAFPLINQGNKALLNTIELAQ